MEKLLNIRKSNEETVEASKISLSENQLVGVNEIVLSEKRKSETEVDADLSQIEKSHAEA